jgi:hypothetical protein
MVLDHTTLIEGDDSSIMMIVYPFFPKVVASPLQEH